MKSVVLLQNIQRVCKLRFTLKSLLLVMRNKLQRSVSSFLGSPETFQPPFIIDVHVGVSEYGMESADDIMRDVIRTYAIRMWIFSITCDKEMALNWSARWQKTLWLHAILHLQTARANDYTTITSRPPRTQASSRSMGQRSRSQRDMTYQHEKLVTFHERIA